MFSRKMSPVQMWGTPRIVARRAACVPLPATGGPTIRIRASAFHGHSSGVGVSDANVLGFEVFLDAFGTTLATESGLLDTAEGCRGI